MRRTQRRTACRLVKALGVDLSSSRSRPGKGTDAGPQQLRELIELGRVEDQACRGRLGHGIAVPAPWC